MIYSRYQQKLNRYETIVNELFLAAERQSASALNTPLQEGKWSTGQQLFHVIRVSEVTMDYLEYKIQQQAAAPKAGISSFVRSTLLNIALILPLKFKAPAITAAVGEDHTISDLTVYHQQQIIRIKAYLGQMTAADRKKALFKHPRAGRISMDQTLRFLALHARHHLKQVNKGINN